LLDDDDGFLHVIEDFAIQALAEELCRNMPASRHTTRAAFPRDINTSIEHLSRTICAALNLFFGTPKLLSKLILSQSLVPKNPARSRRSAFLRSPLISKEKQCQQCAYEYGGYQGLISDFFAR
jgi:hypothetical protein